MFVFFEWLRRLFLRRRVIVYTLAGKVTYKRPKAYTAHEYRTLVNDWMAVDRKTQKLGDDGHWLVIKTEDIIAIEVH